MDRFFVNLKVGSSIQRFNYAIDDSDDLFHPHSHHHLGADTQQKIPNLADLHLRVERQVLQRLPETGALLFSIRTYVTPITTVCADIKVAKALRTSTRSYSEEIAKYKNKPLWDKVLDDHLDVVLRGEGLKIVAS